MKKEADHHIAHLDFTIAASGTTSSALDLGGMGLVGLYLPAALTGTAVSFTVSSTLGGTYVPLTDKNDSATDKSLTYTASKYLPLDPADFAGVRFIKIVSNDTEASARTITAALRSLSGS